MSYEFQSLAKYQREKLMARTSGAFDQANRLESHAVYAVCMCTPAVTAFTLNTAKFIQPMLC